MAVYHRGMVDFLRCPHREDSDHVYSGDVLVQLRESTDAEPGLYMHFCPICASLVYAAMLREMLNIAMKSAVHEALKDGGDASPE